MNEDALLESYLTISSRRIDTWTGRRFYTVAAETRYYQGSNLAGWWAERPDNTIFSAAVAIDDATAITSIATDEDGDGTYEITFVPTDYYLMPRNGPLESTPRPYELIRSNTFASTVRRFPNAPESVKVVGTFGYSVEPPWEIVEATLRQAARFYKLRDAVLGTIDGPGVSLGGTVTDRMRVKVDADLEALICPYIRTRKPAGAL